MAPLLNLRRDAEGAGFVCPDDGGQIRKALLYYAANIFSYSM